MASTYSTIPEVRSMLVDTIIPAAIASLPATISVAGTTIALRAPIVTYGSPSMMDPPNSIIVVGPTDGEDTSWATFPDTPIATNRTRDERYTLRVFIWYLIGDTHSNAQRVASEAAWTIFRAVQAQVHDNKNLKGVIAAPGYAFFSRAQDADYNVAEGRGCGLTCSLNVYARV